MRSSKLMKLFLATTVALAALPMAMVNASAKTIRLDTETAAKGAVGIRIDESADSSYKAKIAKGAFSYTYSIDRPDETNTVWLPLQMGNGDYEVSVFEHVTGNKYRVVLSEKLNVTVANEPDVYLNSVQNLDWSSAAKATAKAKELTKGLRTDKAKAAAIRDYIVKNISYDKALARKVTSEYVPDIDGTLASGKAICYGYATLYAAMLRSVGIPAKLAMGTTKLVDEYHAWNEVFLNGKWVVVDTTVDAGLDNGNAKAAFAKKASDYSAVKYY